MLFDKQLSAKEKKNAIISCHFIKHSPYERWKD